ncbi:MAG: kinase [Candidatus Pacebacteria bacterium]|nr:kinase [Candidatus Paceibacterota bacterium]
MNQPSQSPKLIVIRGNSGSGKGTIAKSIRESSDRKIAIVEQDYLRRFILKEKEKDAEALPNIIGLIEQTVTFLLGRGYVVILDGILTMDRYGDMLNRLKDACHDHHFFYMDVSLEETLRRHSTKPNAHEFGETEMRRWYNSHDHTGFDGEVVISESDSIEKAVSLVIKKSNL